MGQQPILNRLLSEFDGEVVELGREQSFGCDAIRNKLISRLRNAWQTIRNEDSSRWTENLLAICELAGREHGYTIQSTYRGLGYGREWLPDVVWWRRNPWPESVEPESEWQVWEDTLTHGGMVLACSCVMTGDREGLQEAVRKMTHSVNVPCLLIVVGDTAIHDLPGELNPRIEVLSLRTDHKDERGD